MRRSVRASALAAAIALAACEGAPSALEPRGPAAARIEGLWWLIFWVATAVFVVVVGFLVVVVMRARRRTEPAEAPWGEQFIVIAGVIVPSFILISIFAVSLRDTAALSSAGGDARLSIEVKSHDWWWEVRYANGAVTANEIRIPVGVPVRLELPSADVIHSFWVPQLQGKIDHIPGRVNELWLEADQPGRFRGQCAEFCGLQHTNMAFYVVAQPRDEFEAWLADEAEPAADSAGGPADGEEIFLATTCAGCHAIRGTPADARVGPDLTHLARRETLFAGTVANTRANLARVITDPQAIKPGVAMPPTALTDAELSALLDYLEGLE